MELVTAGIGLISLATKAAPSIARWLGFPETASSIEGIAKSIFGTSDEKAIENIAAQRPDLWIQWQMQINQLADKNEQRLHEERMAEFQDIASARNTYVETKNNTTPVLATITVAAFFVVNIVALWGAYELLTGNIKVTNIEFALMCASTAGTILGWVNSKADMVWAFFFGSSRGSQEKTAALSQSVGRLLETATKIKR